MRQIACAKCGLSWRRLVNPASGGGKCYCAVRTSGGSPLMTVVEKTPPPNNSAMMLRESRIAHMTSLCLNMFGSAEKVGMLLTPLAKNTRLYRNANNANAKTIDRGAVEWSFAMIQPMKAGSHHGMVNMPWARLEHLQAHGTKNVLRLPGENCVRLDRREFNGDHCYLNWRGSFADGPIFLLKRNR